VIIIDDGSKEDIASAVKEKISTDIEVKVIRQANAERGAARNNGIRNSSGKYIVIFDSDDYMLPDHLAVLYEGIENNNKPDFIATKYNFTDENNKIYPSDITGLTPGKYNYISFLNGNTFGCLISFRKDNPQLVLFEEDRSYAILEDWMFNVVNLKNNFVILLPPTTVTVYDHSERSMKVDNQLIIGRKNKAAEWIKKRVPLSADEIKQLEAHCDYFCGIHAYLDGAKMQAFKYSLGAILNGGMKTKYLSLMMKSLVGRNLILKLKRNETGK
jgi:GalNAc5-diNAcBac-PP-undecaprenol beta-1,3-glucosyltransferase